MVNKNFTVPKPPALCLCLYVHLLHHNLLFRQAYDKKVHYGAEQNDTKDKMEGAVGTKKLAVQHKYCSYFTNLQLE